MSEVDEKLAKAEEQLRKTHPELFNKGVTVKIDTKNMETVLKRLAEVELENRQLREGKTPTKDEFEKGANFEEKMRKFVKTMKDVEKQMEEEEGKGGKGTISLRPEDLQREKGHSGKSGFESNEEMIDYLREQSKQGDKEAKENLDKLWRKTINSLKYNPQQVAGGVVYPNSPEGEVPEKTSTEKVKEAQNKDWRKRHPSDIADYKEDD